MRVCRCLAVAAALLAAGPAQASPTAWSGHRTESRVIRHRIRVRPVAVVPVVPPPVLVWDYLPRNHSVPLYNQPPRSMAW
ncbi:hypothetical protein SAMN05216360_107155 [Methylobacterium phyllostachyos]|uniref:Uncharacterized protein n=1 Tax=Methylobacterium phyllostachyos TaxID=582672 RepID=A0A1H0AD93_9HYPH|nr:hypothetical protein [Methylobacterium phyllostachyos]SDN31284.1 hypothetical protein SAMN05216360_107155 [Methylobacterium phyllostachyos]